MTEHAEEPGHNPSRLIADGRAAKEAHRQYLGDVLTGRAWEQPETDELAARIATMITPVIGAAIDAVLTGRADEPPVPASAAPGFDGGARQSVPRAPPSHGDWVVAVVGQRLADRRGDF